MCKVIKPCIFFNMNYLQKKVIESFAKQFLKSKNISERELKLLGDNPKMVLANPDNMGKFNNAFDSVMQKLNAKVTKLDNGDLKVAISTDSFPPIFSNLIPKNLTSFYMPKEFNANLAEQLPFGKEWVMKNKDKANYIYGLIFNNFKKKVK